MASICLGLNMFNREDTLTCYIQNAHTQEKNEHPQVMSWSKHILDPFVHGISESRQGYAHNRTHLSFTNKYIP